MSPPEQQHNNINNTNHGTTDSQATKRRCVCMKTKNTIIKSIMALEKK